MESYGIHDVFHALNSSGT